MITETIFAREFLSFWRIAAPTIEGFVRRLNGGVRERDYEPLNSMTHPNRRSFVNEVAFEVFCGEIMSLKRGGPRGGTREAIDIAVVAVREATINCHRDGDYQSELTSEERLDTLEQSRRLRQRLTSWGDPASVRPKPEFPGCGIVDTCYGDVLIGETLFEIKAGDRLFRSIDVRQLLTYLALNHASGKYLIRRAGLVNPRVGVSTELDIDELCYQVSGRDEGGLLWTISHGLSSAEISR